MLKENAIRPHLELNKNKIFYLTGIGKGLIETKGEITLSLKGIECKFQIVPTDFPIAQKGILGIEFLSTQGATLQFDDTRNGKLVVNRETFPFETHDTIYLPPRTKKLVTLTIKSTRLKSGYIRRIETGPNVHLGEVLVTPKSDNTVSIFAINSTYEPIELTLPPVELEDCLIVKPQIRTCTETDDNITKETVKTKRFCDVIKNLKLQDLSEDETTSLLTDVNLYPYQFHIPGDRLGFTSVTAHKIKTTDEIPTHAKIYRYPQIHKEEIKSQVGDLLKNDIIESSNSPYNSPVWIVPKKADSQGRKRWRMVIDYRALNEKTISDAYPLPNITDILDQLGGAKYFTTLDLASGFHQIPMDPESKAKTAFSTPHGHYEFKRMPFGLKNAPPTFQRLMDQILSGLQGVELFVYMDDIVIYANSLEEHSRKLRKLLGRLKSAGLTLQPDKCNFLRKEIAYLGHVITQDGVKPDSSKIEAVRNFPIPKNRKNIKQFLGLVGYYRKFIPDFARIAKPLNYLTRLDVKFQWGDSQQSAFEALRDRIISEPILQYPDFTKAFVVTTDASDYALGAVLSQGEIGKDLPIAFASRTLNAPETRYSTTEKELLAIIFGVEHFRPYLYGQRFTLVTDHRPLVWLHNIKNPASKLARWKLRLAEYDYNVVYKPGRINSNADALSRNPIDNLRNNETVEEVVEVNNQDDDLNQWNQELIGRIFLTNSEVKEIIQNDSCQTDLKHAENKSKISSDNESDSESESDSGSDFYESAVESESRSSPFREVDNPLSRQANGDYHTLCCKPPRGETGSELDSVSSVSLIGNPTISSKSTTQNRRQTCVGGGTYLSELVTKNLQSKNSLDARRGKKVDVMVNSLMAQREKEIWPVRDPRISISPAHVSLNNLEEETISTGELGGLSPGKRKFTSKVCPESKRIKFDSDNSNACLDIAHVYLIDRDCIIYKRDQLVSRGDNLLHFVSRDCKFNSITSRDLSSEGFIRPDELQQAEPEVGQILSFQHGNRYIFNAVIKESCDDRIVKNDLKSILKALKTSMISLNEKSVSMSRYGNGFDGITWLEVEDLIAEIFKDTGITIHVCTGEIKVPLESERENIIREAHNSVIGGHRGVNKTLNRIRERFCWPRMRSDIENFVKYCESCQKKKIVRVKTRQPMKITDTPKEAFDKVQMDLVGPLPRTTDGNIYILTLQDCLTKYSEAIPIPDQEAITVAMALAENFITRFGCPRSIQTDQGSNFMSQLFSSFCKIFKIRQFKSTAYHPQSLGALERSHSVLVEYLRHFANTKDWDKWLRFAMFSYNSSVHEATRFTPHELIFGKKARIPSEFEEDCVPRTFIEHMDDLLHKLSETQAKAITNINKAKQKYKRNYDKKLNPRTFRVGEYVRLQKGVRANKLSDYYEGPYQITQVFDDRNVELQVKPNERRIVHSNRLEKAYVHVDS